MLTDSSQICLPQCRDFLLVVICSFFRVVLPPTPHPTNTHTHTQSDYSPEHRCIVQMWCTHTSHKDITERSTWSPNCFIFIWPWADFDWQLVIPRLASHTPGQLCFVGNWFILRGTRKQKKTNKQKPKVLKGNGTSFMQLFPLVFLLSLVQKSVWLIGHYNWDCGLKHNICVYWWAILICKHGIEMSVWCAFERTHTVSSFVLHFCVCM